MVTVLRDLIDGMWLSFRFAAPVKACNPFLRISYSWSKPLFSLRFGAKDLGCEARLHHAICLYFLNLKCTVSMRLGAVDFLFDRVGGVCNCCEAVIFSWELWVTQCRYSLDLQLKLKFAICFCEYPIHDLRLVLVLNLKSRILDVKQDYIRVSDKLTLCFCIV